jgi:hypothetical protein
MSKFDLSELSDGELFELVEECREEVSMRASKLDTGAALGGQYLSAADRATAETKALEYQIKQLHQAALAKAERKTVEDLVRHEAEQQALKAAEAERLRWARRKGIALAAQELFTPDPKLQITVWVGSDGEKRIYVDHGFGGAKLATYYATGNRKNPPGTFETGKRREERLAFCKAVAAAYSAMKLNVETAVNWGGEAVQIPGYNPPKVSQ